MNKTHIKEIIIGEEDLTLNQIIEIVKGKAKIKISSDNRFITKLENSKKMLLNAMKSGIPVYGVTTGYGKSCGKRMAMEVALKNGINLIHFHGCGTGEPLGIEEIRAAMLTRILCFAKGYSGVSIELLERMVQFLNNDITPVVPALGSVGASGDLTPMSYIAAALLGDREVFYKGKRIPATEAINKAGLKEYSFGPKEPIALINGTATMTGIALITIHRSKKIMDAAILATALSIHALMGNAHHYHATIAKAKPHPGQEYVARQILDLLYTEASHSDLEAKLLETLQDPYSIRCSPQIVGVLYDALTWINKWIEIEANSANDNPIFDPDSGQVLMGGNFYGGHVAFAMDSLKSALASIADMSDRQIALLVDPNVNRDLPADLVKVKEEKKLYNHGFKAMSITSSALAAEALKLTMPAASFSRSTESHNQDKVSMGTIAARDAERICYLVERVVSIHLLAAAQACEIREKSEYRLKLKDIIEKIRAIAQSTIEDRPMDMDIENIAQAISDSDIFNLDDND